MTLTDTLTWLVDIDSPYGHEESIATAVGERLGRSRPVQRIGNGLVVGEADDRPMVLLVGHLDTVPRQGQGPAAISGGRLRGLGASDMKSGLAVLIHLLEDAEVASGPWSTVGVFYDREEGPVQDNQLGPILEAEPWLAEAEFAIVGEPTDLAIEVGCNGAMNIRCHFEGRSAHSARPWLGENAIHRASRLLGRLAEREPVDVEVGGLIFREVMSATLAEGGVSRNVIPKDFSVNVSYRFPPTLTLDEAEERFRSFVGDDADRLEFVDRAPAGPVPEHSPYLERLLAVSGAAMAPKQGWTDVARLAQFGVSAVNYGPGETAQAHQVDESVALANLDRARDVLAAWLTTA